MSDSEATRKSSPSTSDLSLSSQTSVKPINTEGKPNKDVEKSMCFMQQNDSICIFK